MTDRPAPTDAELIAFAVEEEFLLFCDQEDFVEIARAVLAKWGTPPPAVAREPLTDEQIQSMCKQSWVFETAKQWVRVIEAAHGIKEPQ